MKWRWVSWWFYTPLPLFFLAHLSHDICPSMLVPLLPLVREDFRLNYLQSGLLLSAFSITSGLSQLPMGWLADRLGRRILVTVGMMGVGVATILVGFSPGYIVVLMVLITMGLFAGAYHPSATSYLPRYFPPEQRGRVLGLHLVGGTVGWMMGPVLGGLLAAFFGWRSAFMALGLLPLVVAPLFLRFMRNPGEVPADSEAKIEALKAPPKTQGILASLVSIWWPFTLAVMAALTIGSVMAYLSVYLVEKHGLTPTSAAMLLALVRGIGIVGATLGGVLSDRMGTVRSLQLAVAITGPVLLLATLLPLGPLFIVLLMVYGVMANMREVPVQSLVFSSTPQHHTATVMGLYFFLSMEGTSIIVPPVGYLMDRVGLANTFIGLAVAVTIISALALLVRAGHSSSITNGATSRPLP